jgi:hypothetical protein
MIASYQNLFHSETAPHAIRAVRKVIAATVRIAEALDAAA